MKGEGNLKMSDIAASLEYGLHLTGILYFMIISILIGGCFLELLVPIIFLYEEPPFEYEVILIPSIMGGIFILISAIWLIKNNLLKRKMRIWMEDAVELYAYSEELSKIGMLLQVSETKIRVKFQWEGRNYVRISGNGKRKAYQKVFTKYANRYIRILYSPKYDQIMILKDK